MLDTMRVLTYLSPTCAPGDAHHWRARQYSSVPYLAAASVPVFPHRCRPLYSCNRLIVNYISSGCRAARPLFVPVEAHLFGIPVEAHLQIAMHMTIATHITSDLILADRRNAAWALVLAGSPPAGRPGYAHLKRSRKASPFRNVPVEAHLVCCNRQLPIDFAE